MFNISIPHQSDAHRIATIHIAAMQPNILLHAQFPTQKSLASLHKFLVQDTLMHLRSPDKEVLIVTDDSSKDIVGFLKWEFPSDSADNREDELDWPEDCCRKYLDGYYELTKKAEKEAIGEMRCCHVSFVCTDPAWQCRGIGSWLVREVLERAQAMNLPVYLESTLEAVPLYKKLGFKTVGVFEMEIPSREDTSAVTTYGEVCLIWKPS